MKRKTVQYLTISMDEIIALVADKYGLLRKELSYPTIETVGGKQTVNMRIDGVEEEALPPPIFASLRLRN